MDRARELFELLERELEAILALADGNIQTEKQLREQERVLQTKQKDWSVSVSQFAKDKELFDQEKQFLTKANGELSTKKNQLEVKEQDIQEKLTQLGTREKEIQTKQEALDLKIKIAQDVDEKLAKLAEREQLMEKKEAIDQSRKEMLEIQARANQTEVARLKKISDSMQV